MTTSDDQTARDEATLGYDVSDEALDAVADLRGLMLTENNDGTRLVNCCQ
jgi:hypothetical protein